MSANEDKHEQEEERWIAGNRAAWLGVLRMCLSELGWKGDEAEKHAWILEREAVVTKLRELCGVYGDNDWEPTLHLEDVIEKHLFRDLEDRLRMAAEHVRTIQHAVNETQDAARLRSDVRFRAELALEEIGEIR